MYKISSTHQQIFPVPHNISQNPHKTHTINTIEFISHCVELQDQATQKCTQI